LRQISSPATFLTTHDQVSETLNYQRNVASKEPKMDVSGRYQPQLTTLEGGEGGRSGRGRGRHQKHTHIHTNAHTYTNTHTRTHKHTHSKTHTRIHSHNHTLTLTHTDTLADTHTHARQLFYRRRNPNKSRNMSLL
jgi:hypothetical protein